MAKNLTNLHKKQRRLIASFALTMGLGPGSAFAWDPSDAKSVDELQLMNDDELNSEARQMCVGAAVARDVERSQSADAQTAYLDTIMQVTRSKHQGQAPWWITEYQQAAQTTDASKCAAINVKRLQRDPAEANEAEHRQKATGKQESPAK
jgi:hypothetical protein